MLSRSSLMACFAVLAAALPAAAQDDPMSRRARSDYMLHCSGCHDMDGSGHPAKGIPAFQDQIGYFTAIPEGRAMLMQIPGLLSSGLSDERAAAVTTWLVTQFAGLSLPADFQPYTAAEAKRHRENRPVDIAATRARLYKQIVDSGYPLK
jgi:cytochrome c553